VTVGLESALIFIINAQQIRLVLFQNLDRQNVARMFKGLGRADGPKADACCRL
jgi:hypothetical protein